MSASIHRITAATSGGKSMHLWEPLIRAYTDYLDAIGQPTTTIGLRDWQVRSLAKTLGVRPDRVDTQSLVDFLKLHRDWKADTRRSFRDGINGFFRWAVKFGHLPANPVDDLPTVRGSKGKPKPCPENVYRAALLKADERQTLMLKLGADAGLRRGEICQVHRNDLRRTTGGPELLVRGKGAKQRIIPVTEDIAERIERASAYCFPSLRGAHLTPTAVGVMLSDLLGSPWTAHTLRHRYATAVYRASKDLRALQELLGHSSLAITQRYVDTSQDEMRAAMLAGIA